MLIEDIEIFKVVYETKSISQAAERLYISRPGLSQKITNIEARYGVKLFDRTSQGVFPTQAGLIAIRFANRVRALESDLEAEIAALGECFEPTVTIGASLADGVELLPKIIKRFMDENPSTRVHLETGYEPEILQKMYNFEVDFAILENVPLTYGFSVETLGYKELYCLAPDKAPYNILPRPVKPDVFLKLQLPMIIYEWDSGRHMVGDRHFREHHGISLKDFHPVACFDTHEAMMNGIRAGIGWGMIPEAIARRYRNMSGIIRVIQDTPPVTYPVNLVKHTKHVLSHEAASLMEFTTLNLTDLVARDTAKT